MTIFIVLRNNDLEVFASVFDAEQYMESPDIESGEYVAAFDEVATIYSIQSLPVERSRFMGMGLVSVTPGIQTKTEKQDAERLSKILKEKLNLPADVQYSLLELVECTKRTFKFL